MTVENIVVIDGEEVLIESLPETEQEELADRLNINALLKKNYIVDKTA